MTNVHKVLGKTARLANMRGNQTLFRAFAVGTTKPLSNNNYSTKAKKENFINIPAQLHNNKLMNIFPVDFKNYSSSVVNSTNTTKSMKVLNPLEYKSWPKEDVCSLLCRPEENGGAGLTIEDVQPLYDAGFKGTSLDNIIRDLRGKNLNAVDEAQKSFPSLKRDTLRTVVNWVDNLLKTRLYHLWTDDQVREQLCKPVGKGGAGLSIEEVKTWFADFDISFIGETIKVLGNNHNTEMARKTLYETFKNAPKDLSDNLVNWVDNTFQIEIEFDPYSHYLITQMYTEDLFPLLVEKCMNSIGNRFEKSKNIDFEKNDNILAQEKERTKNALGKLGKKNADWPIAFSGNQTTLDWRFSNVILPSELESDQLAKIREGSSFSSYHEFICDNFSSEHKIRILLALSGAGKTHSLFHISISETAFTIPLDFGSKEDLHLRPMQFALDNISSIKFTPNDSNDTKIRMKNLKSSEEVTSILTTSIVIRMLVLLGLLKQKRNEGKDLSPSMWIRFVYNGGSGIINDLEKDYQPILQQVNKNPEFLHYVIKLLQEELLHNPHSSKMIITVDEINALVNTGYGINTIPYSDPVNTIDTPRFSSVLTLLFRILENCLTYTPSMLSGTKINNALLEEIVSARMKNKLEVLTAYGPPEQEQISKFALKFLSPPKIDLGFGCTLFDAITSLLVGRRRIIAKYLYQIRLLSLESPCPNDPDQYNSWAVNILLKALEVYTLEKNNFGKDVKKFLSNNGQPQEIANVKREIGLYLLLKNRVTSKEVTNLLMKYGFDQNDKHLALIKDAIIYNGLGFGELEFPYSFSDTTFVMTEITIMILLNQVYSIEEMKNFLNIWLKDTLNSKENPNSNNNIGLIFEVLGALILKVLGKKLNGAPITDDPIFSQYKGTKLEEFKLPTDLSIVCSKHYWKYLLIAHKQPGMSSFFKHVCVFGLDQSIKIDVKSIATNIHDENKILDINMASKFITTPSYEDNKELIQNFNATDINNAFLTNKSKSVQSGKEYMRNQLEEQLLKDPTIRVVFDYNTHITMEAFNKLVDDDSSTKKTKGKPSDFIVLLSKNNPQFMQFFRSEFAEINATIEQHLRK